MRRKNFIGLILLSLLISCGPNAEEIAQQQRHRDDSIAHVTAARIERKNSLENNLRRLKNQFINSRADIEVAYDKLNKLKEFHLFRTDEEREQQIKQQTIFISQLEESREKMSVSINEVQQDLANIQ